MNNFKNDCFFIFSAVTENNNYGKMLARILNNENFFLKKLDNIFIPFKYGEEYKGVLITLYLGDFEYIPTIYTPHLSNFSRKDKEWNFKIPVPEELIEILVEPNDFNAFIKINLLELENILKKRKVKNFNFELFRADIELI